MIRKILTGVRPVLGVSDFFTLLKVALVFAGLGTAHYIGFLSNIPSEVLTIISLKFLTSFVSVFVFYLMFGFYAAKVFAFAFSQFYYCLFAPFFVFLRKLAGSNLFRQKKAALKIYKESDFPEKIVYWMAFLSIFFAVLFALYLRLNYELVSRQAIVGAGVLVLAAFFKTGILNRPKKQLLRILDKRRVSLRRKLTREYAVFLSSVAVLVSFYSGLLRCEMLAAERAAYLEVGKYSGSAKILLSSGDEFLALDDDFYIYSSSDFFIKIPKVLTGRE